MAIRIHHTQVKQAAKLGIALTVADGGVLATKEGWNAHAANAKLAVAKLLQEMGATTADTMKSLRPKAVAIKKSKGARKAAKAPKFRCEGDDCRSTKREKTEDGWVCCECGEDASMDGDDEGASVVKRKYRTKYKPHRMTCGDALSKQIRAEFMTVKDPDTKKLKLDWKRFTAFAVANGCWSSEYSKLNKGMRRMNIVNRLRAKIAAKHEVVWSA